MHSSRSQEVAMDRPVIRSLAVVLVAGGVAGCAARAQKAEPSAAGVKPSGVAVAVPAAAEAVPPHVLAVPSAMRWQRFPPGGAGVTMTVLSGDPEKAGPFVRRIKSPAGAKVPPHWHPTDEHVTVVSGAFAVGMGDTFDPKALKTVPAGSYLLLPREMRHFALSKTPTVVQVHGIGPFQVNFVNPADDPRNKNVPR
jgi:quercetin dioxygenase-like cupin family protein